MEKVGTHAYYRLALVLYTTELDKHKGGGGGLDVKNNLNIFIYSGTGFSPLYYVVVDGLCNGLNGVNQWNLINDKIMFYCGALRPCICFQIARNFSLV